MDNIKGYIYAAASSSTFGLAPFFTISLLSSGFSSFEVLAYRWGVASFTLIIFGIFLGETFCINRKDFGTVFILSLFRAATSLSLVIAYQHIASGVTTEQYSPGTVQYGTAADTTAAAVRTPYQWIQGRSYKWRSCGCPFPTQNG